MVKTINSIKHNVNITRKNTFIQYDSILSVSMVFIECTLLRGFTLVHFCCCFNLYCLPYACTWNIHTYIIIMICKLINIISPAYPGLFISFSFISDTLSGKCCFHWPNGAFHVQLKSAPTTFHRFKWHIPSGGTLSQSVSRSYITAFIRFISALFISTCCSWFHWFGISQKKQTQERRNQFARQMLFISGLSLPPGLGCGLHSKM